jgi:hypothetical protein
VTTYYRDATVWVTGEWVEVGRQRLPIAELSYVWHDRGRPTTRTAVRALARYGLITALTVPVVAGGVLLAYPIASEFGPIAVAGTAVLLVIMGVGLLSVVLSPVLEFPLMALERSYDRGLTVRELWVRWRDEDLLLLRTSDAARFGKIYRAIERAIERFEG